MLEITSTPLVIMAILGTVGVLIPIISIARKEQGSNSFYAVIAFAALIVSIGYVGYQFINDNVAASALFSEDVLVDDAFGGFFAIAMLIVALFTTVGSFNYMRKHNSPAVYYSLILLATIGMVLVAYSTDLVMLFVAWELMSLPTYILVGFIKKNPSSNEAALKYFLFGALSSAIIVYGISIAYGLTGSTNIGEVIQGYSTLDPSFLPLALLSVGMFIAGFGFKMGLVPFHQWLPDTYEGAPPPIAALLAAGTKKVGFAAAIRIIVLGMVVLNLDWTLALGVLAVMTMTIGNIAAIMQKNLTRMLAYSSIAHAGYILIGLAVAPYSSLGLQGSLYHILNHAVMKGMAFIAIAGIVTTLAVTNLDKLQGLGRRMPITALALVISLFALAGVPPLAGFWSKLMLFGSALDAGSVVWWAPWLAIAGVLNSALSLAYYAWITRKMYFEGEREKRVKEPKSIIAIMIFSMIFLIGFGVYPEPVMQFVEFATPVLSLDLMP
ncbi:NADH-quinone oxidoreductase subunit N [Marine Group I thaumarchaeote]|uniref:NADH-quinone oxidoreductase subunit N n=1 Tax=Marine Group I thaumarchaeote TaxID=2511932 RepID=A0A7K4N530_9ARCH|nr:MAG: NADH-quinone oxidoreductase subunit N [Nitrosopumilus sp. YT1]NMI81824.1 NADH-quinone oxidoreductase subunit N [Candidatus Nitrosopumilus sp. MTA1]NWJ19763.1 NADH-quinone oxidoreductase subunit N [Marine Group I thaumarchaeote]NWJ56669.1 NADH-quinone oxidoreductase subunit N [Marine Group I thaumarchaeote]NWJ83531.1 NADH-quinone oxidoreductase subunit N [Marine Group I thaumarchaeote]